MVPSRTFATISVAALLSALLVGCGSSGDDSLTAKQFRAQANKLCSDASDDSENLGSAISEKSSDEEVSKAIDGLVARNKELVKDIAALKAPKSLQGDVDSMLDSVRKVIGKLDAVSSLAELSTMADPFTEADQKAKDLGLAACAS